MLQKIVESVPTYKVTNNSSTFMNWLDLESSSSLLIFVTLPTILKIYSVLISIYILIKVFRGKLPKFEYFLEVILVDIAILLISPLIVGLVLFLIILRTTLNLYLRIRHNGKVKLVRNSDAFWACDSYLNANYIYALGFVEGTCTMEQHRNKVNRMFQLDHLLGANIFGRLKCKLVQKFGFQCWQIDENFDVNIIAQYLIEKEPFKPMTKEDILSELAIHYDYPMPDDEPKWKLYLIPNYIAENNTSGGKKHWAFVWKINHAYMDGLSITNIFSWFFFDEAVTLAIDPFKPLKVTFFQKMFINMKLLLMGPHCLVKSILFKEKHFFHGPQPTGPKTLGVSRPIDINSLKVIKNATGTSITTLLISGLGGGMRRFALRKGAEVPKSIGSGVTAAIFPYDGLKPTNRFTMARMTMRINSNDIKARLESAAKSAVELSKSIEFLLVHHTVNFIGLFPNSVISKFINDSDSTLIFSNVPGPIQRYHIERSLVTDIITWNVIKGCTGLGVCLYSYGGRVRAGIVGDACIFPEKTDINALLEEFENEIGDIAEYSGITRSSVFLD